MREIVAIVNPNSAGGNTMKLWPQIKSTIEKSVGEFSPLFTSRPNHAPELCKDALKEGAKLVISVGGDGTANEVVNGFFEVGKPINPNAEFAIISMGSGSDLIKTLGVPKLFEDAVRAIAQGVTRTIDAGIMGFVDHSGNEAIRHFINIASFGVGGEVDERVNRSKKRFGGFMAFFTASLISLLTYKNKLVEIELDGKSLGEKKILLCAVANGRFFGSGMMVAPNAQIDDGLFDVVIIGESPKLKLFMDMPKIYSGAHLANPKTEVYRAKKVVARSAERVLLDVDGEQPGRLNAWFEIIPNAIKARVPKGA